MSEGDERAMARISLSHCTDPSRKRCLRRSKICGIIIQQVVREKSVIIKVEQSQLTAIGANGSPEKLGALITLLDLEKCPLSRNESVYHGLA